MRTLQDQQGDQSYHPVTLKAFIGFHSGGKIPYSIMIRVYCLDTGKLGYLVLYTSLILTKKNFALLNPEKWC